MAIRMASHVLRLQWALIVRLVLRDELVVSYLKKWKSLVLLEMTLSGLCNKVGQRGHKGKSDN